MSQARHYFCLITLICCLFLRIGFAADSSTKTTESSLSIFCNHLWSYAPQVIPAASAASSVMGFMGVACAGGVCPVVVATGTGSLLSVAGIGALIGHVLASTSEACFESYSAECISYLAIPAVIGGAGGYVVVKVYDRAKKPIVRWLRTIIANNELHQEELPADTIFMKKD